MANGPRRDDDQDLRAEEPAFSDNGMRRIVYGQDGEDSRSAAFTQDTEELEADLRQRRSLVPVVTALAAIFCFGAIVWYAYTWGTGQLASEDLPVVTAQPLPEKVKPEQPGGMDVPHQGIAILNEDTRGGSGDQVERLLPPPEDPAPPEPLPELVAEPAPDGSEAPDAQLADDGRPQESPGETLEETGEGLTADTPAIDTPNVDVPAIAEAQAPPAESEAGDAAIMTPVPKPEDDPDRDQIAALIQGEPLETANGEAADPPAPAQSAALTEGDVVLQLSSVKSQAAARSEWARLQQEHPDQLGSQGLSLDSAVVQGTTYYRVQTGPFASRAAAAELCDQLKARNQDCLVTQR